MTSDIDAFRAQELLLKRATEGLDPAEAAELAALGADHELSFDLAAAAIDLATLRLEDMPRGVADKVLVAAGVAPRASVPAAPIASPATTLAGVVPPRPVGATPPAHAASLGEAPTMPQPAREAPAKLPVSAPTDVVPIESRRSRSSTVIAWSAAATALAIAAAAVLWVRTREPEVIVKETERVVLPATPSPSDARAQLLASAADLETLSWTATPDEAAKGASGDVVWSPSQQRGFMRFVGLAPNDPTKTQYQLWIFDKTRDERFPVDGGVFDVTSTGEVIVPITAKLPVAEPVLFAVTVEQPGGVVVSKRERIVVTAAPKSG